jgi:sulfur carrier protein
MSSPQLTPAMMEVTVNGEAKQVPNGLDVTKLLAHLGIRSDRVAIERNLEILPRDSWGATIVSAGDNFEIVHFVGGG